MSLSCPKLSKAPTSLRVKAKPLQWLSLQHPAHLWTPAFCSGLHPPFPSSHTRPAPASWLLLTELEGASAQGPSVL